MPYAENSFVFYFCSYAVVMDPVDVDNDRFTPLESHTRAGDSQVRIVWSNGLLLLVRRFLFPHRGSSMWANGPAVEL